MIGSFHLCGPFLSASVAVDKFGQNLYQASLLGEAVDIYTEYLNKIEIAIQDEADEVYITSLKAESDYYEQLFKISLAGVLSTDEVQ